MRTNTQVIFRHTIILSLLNLIVFFGCTEEKTATKSLQPRMLKDPFSKMLRLSYDDIDTGMTPEEGQAAFKEWRTKAEKGDRIAQNNVGDHYVMGWGVEKDEKEGIKWYRLSAEQGYSHAQHNLAACLYYGRGTQKNVDEAIKWWKLSAGQGFAPAQLSLGACYGMGIGVTQNDAEAFAWYKKAAEQGDSFGEYQVASYYEKGVVVKKDLNEAEKWYLKSAEKGNPMGQYKCSEFCYRRGDEANMLIWQTQAADQGYAPAQYNLGISYAYGNGVTEDMEKAREWIKKAAEQGEPNAIEWLDHVKTGKWK